MHTIVSNHHDLSYLDQRHLGLLTLIVAVWFASAWAGERLRACSNHIAVAVVLLACSTVVIAFIIDPWLGLASLQVPLFAWKGYRTGSFV